MYVFQFAVLLTEVEEGIVVVGEGVCFESKLLELLFRRYIPAERIMIANRTIIINGHLGNEVFSVSDSDWFLT